jgi:hypothetical protein
MAKPRLLKLLTTLGCAGLVGFVVGSIDAKPARGACLDNEFTYDLCYEPFRCNETPLVSFVRTGVTYLHHNFQSFACPNCPEQFYDTEYGIDYDPECGIRD